MILSQRHKFIFIAIPKTGTHAIREFIRPYLGPYDWEQCNLFTSKSIPIPQIAKLKHGHISANNLKKVLPGYTWNEYYSFAFVRNPYDRFLSYINFKFAKNEDYQKDANRFIIRFIQDTDALDGKVLLRPQCQFVYSEGTQVVKFIGRYERILEGIALIMETLDLQFDLSKFRVVNSSVRNRNGQELPDQAREFIRAYYSKDFELFGYAK